MNPIVYEKTNPIARGGIHTIHSTMHPQQRIGTLDFLNDRNVFNQVSQTQEQIDFSPTSPQDYEIGMRMSGTSMRNNKKSLINNPYIDTTQNNSSFNNMSTETDDGNGFSSTSYSSLLSTGNEHDEFTQCPIEREMVIHEFTENLKRPANRRLVGVEHPRTAINNILFDVTSPFAKTYMWKALILLATNPYNEQLTAMIDGNKDEILLDMKKTAPYMAEQGTVTITIPQKSETFNTNIITKFEEIYKIKIKMLREAKVASIFLTYSFSLKIPQIYKPYESNFQLLGLNERIKSVVLTGALCAMNQYHDLFCLEIQMGENMVLGFAYTVGQTIIGTIPIEFINQEKSFAYTIGKLVIPKLNKKRVKQNEEVLAGVHFGELCYGDMQTVVMGSSVEFAFGVCQEEFVVGKGNKLIGEVVVNHPCFYYVKNGRLKNKLLIAGLIHY